MRRRQEQERRQMRRRQVWWQKLSFYRMPFTKDPGADRGFLSTARYTTVSALNTPARLCRVLDALSGKTSRFYVFDRLSAVEGGDFFAIGHNARSFVLRSGRYLPADLRAVQRLYQKMTDPAGTGQALS